MAVLKRCKSKDERLDSDDDNCKDLKIYLLKYTKVIMILMMIIVSFDDCDDHDGNYYYYDHVCFTDSSADTSQHRHEITGSAAEE